MSRNVHTSVVIELANQGEPEEQKVFKIYFDDLEPPKDYVIDQIFCGENITIYELFEISNFAHKKSDKQLVELTDLDINNDYKFYHRNSCKTKINEKKIEECMKAISVICSNEDFDLLLSNDHRNESLYCLKHFGGTQKLSREEENLDLKVLCNNDLMLNNQNSKKFKAVSKGVNTDIAQSPKLLEEIQKALSLNFFRSKSKTSLTSCNVSYEVIGMDIGHSSSSLNSEIDTKKQQKSSSNFLLIPFFLLEDDILAHLNKDETRQLSEEKALCLKTGIRTEKISMGINTDFTEFKLNIPKIEDDTKEEKTHLKNVNLCNCQIVCEREKSSEVNNTKEIEDLHLKLMSKETILDEIRILQWKLNSLVKLLETNDFKFNPEVLDQTNNLELLAPTKLAEENENVKQEIKSENIPEKLVVETGAVRRNQKKFDDLPIFSPLCYSHPTNKVSNKKSRKGPPNTKWGERKKEPLIAAKSTTSTNYTISSQSSINQNVSENSKAELNLKDSLKELFINWDDVINKKGSGVSKSEPNQRCITLDKCTFFHGLKKSLSLNLYERRSDVGLKKVKNTFKLEGNLKSKSDVRIHQNEESSLGDKLTSFKCEMGDEVNKKSKLNFSDLIQTTGKIGEIAKDIEKNEYEEGVKSKEKGDAKISYQKLSLIPSSYIQNTEKLIVHYCNTNTTASDDLLRRRKTSTLGREKFQNNEKVSNRPQKINSCSGKPTTPMRNLGSSNTCNGNEKKGFLANNRKKVIEKSMKQEKKESLQETPVKQKTVSGGKKFTVKVSAESKLHIDKLIKKTGESKTRFPSSRLHPQSKLRQNDNYIEKDEQMSRSSLPPSQNLRRRELAPGMHLVDSKEKRTGCCRKNSVMLVQVESNLEMKKTLAVNVRENVEHIMVFESKVDESTKSYNLTPGNGIEMSSSDPSSVVVELFSQRPTSVAKFRSELNQECNGKNTVDNFCGKKNSTEVEGISNCYSEEKPIVMSIWALTKVLLYEDGTKKFEVLEESLTPPEYCLKNEKNNT